MGATWWRLLLRPISVVVHSNECVGTLLKAVLGKLRPQEVWRTVHWNARWVRGGTVCVFFLPLAVDDRKARARVELTSWGRTPAQLFLRSGTSRAYPFRGRLLTCERLPGRRLCLASMAKHRLPARVVQAPNCANHVQSFFGLCCIRPVLEPGCSESTIKWLVEAGISAKSAQMAGPTARKLVLQTRKAGLQSCVDFWRTTRLLHAPDSQPRVCHTLAGVARDRAANRVCRQYSSFRLFVRFWFESRQCFHLLHHRTAIRRLHGPGTAQNGKAQIPWGGEKTRNSRTGLSSRPDL